MRNGNKTVFEKEKIMTVKTLKQLLGMFDDDAKVKIMIESGLIVPIGGIGEMFDESDVLVPITLADDAKRAAQESAVMYGN